MERVSINIIYLTTLGSDLGKLYTILTLLIFLCLVILIIIELIRNSNQ